MAIRHALYLGTSWEKALKDATWCLLNRKYGDVYPNLFALMDLVLTLPASTAECERGFSAMKVVKSNQRSSLNGDTLSDLLMVKLHSAEISSFDPHPAMELWKTHSLDAPKKRRRPDYSSDRQRPTKKTASAAGASAGGASADVYDVASDSDNDRGFDHDSDSDMEEDMFIRDSDSDIDIDKDSDDDSFHLYLSDSD